MMSMLNQAAVEAICSATFLRNYLECIENLPNDIQRIISQLRELDLQTNEILNDIAAQRESQLKQENAAQKKTFVLQLQRSLVKCQELGDEKLALAAQFLEQVENRTRQLDLDLENLDPSAVSTIKETESVVQNSSTRSASAATDHPTSNAVSAVSKSSKAEERTDTSRVKRHRRQRTHHEPAPKEEEKRVEEEKPRKKKTKRERNDKSPGHSISIDPEEPTYCLCDQVSYGEMIGCDNEQCPIEWFHFNCVSLTHKPKGKWFCPKCRGDRQNVINPEIVAEQRKEKPGRKTAAD